MPESASSFIQEKSMRFKTILGFLLAIDALGVPGAHAATCESLAMLSDPNTTVTLAETVPAGTFKPPGSTGTQSHPALTNLPAFCRVAATLRPTSDSDIKVEVWLPIAN